MKFSAVENGMRAIRRYCEVAYEDMQKRNPHLVGDRDNWLELCRDHEVSRLVSNFYGIRLSEDNKQYMFAEENK